MYASASRWSMRWPCSYHKHRGRFLQARNRKWCFQTSVLPKWDFHFARETTYIGIRGHRGKNHYEPLSLHNLWPAAKATLDVVALPSAQQIAVDVKITNCCAISSNLICCAVKLLFKCEEILAVSRFSRPIRELADFRLRSNFLDNIF